MASLRAASVTARSNSLARQVYSGKNNINRRSLDSNKNGKRQANVDVPRSNLSPRVGTTLSQLVCRSSSGSSSPVLPSFFFRPLFLRNLMTYSDRMFEEGKRSRRFVYNVEGRRNVSKLTRYIY